MNPEIRRRLLSYSLLVGLIVIAVSSRAQANEKSYGTSSRLNDYAMWTADDGEKFMSFRASVMNTEQAEEIVGVFSPNTFAFKVVQQPSGEPVYISNEDDTVTQFGWAENHQTIGILAHDSRAGEQFVDLKIGSTVVVIYGDGRTQEFIMTDSDKYQAVEPLSSRTDFIDMESGEKLSADQVLNQVYTTEGQMIFQTCFSKDHILSWGREFKIFERVKAKEGS